VSREHRRDASREHRNTGFFILRTPLLPFDTLLDWADAGPDDDALIAHLRALAERPEINEALTLATADLGTALKEKPSRKVLLALARYVTRMSSRSTPFGLFAGCSVGTLNEATDDDESPAAAGVRATHRSGWSCASRNRSIDEETRRRAPLLPTSTRYELAVSSGTSRARRSHPLRRARRTRATPCARLASQRMTAKELAARSARARRADRRRGCTSDSRCEASCRHPAASTTDDPARDFTARLHAIGAPQADTIDALNDELRHIDAAPSAPPQPCASSSKKSMRCNAESHAARRVAKPRRSSRRSPHRRRARCRGCAAPSVRTAEACAAHVPKFRARYDTQFVPLLEVLTRARHQPTRIRLAATTIFRCLDVPIRERPGRTCSRRCPPPGCRTGPDPIRLNARLHRCRRRRMASPIHCCARSFAGRHPHQRRDLRAARDPSGARYGAFLPRRRQSRAASANGCAAALGQAIFADRALPDQLLFVVARPALNTRSRSSR
jgi:hypothetical protein